MNGENKMETVEVKHENLQELYKVLTNYPAISKEQVIHELHKCFGKEAFKLKVPCSESVAILCECEWRNCVCRYEYRCF